jgi:undecaprenyl diphosphate synthase
LRSAWEGFRLNAPLTRWQAGDGAPPRHVAVIMDGNGRWAKKRGLPRTFGHNSGARQVRALVEHCADLGISHVTLFAFSSENWKRPADEVSSLMSLFVLYLEKEIRDMNLNGVRLKVIGDASRFDARLQKLIADAQSQTAGNTRITLTVAANYGGRWDMLEAVRRWQAAHPQRPVSELSEADIATYLSMADAPDPDLLIRTGGESRVSNFLLWQLAYAELYFTDVLWPDFSVQELDKALAWYADKDRRFGAVTQSVAS